MTNYFKILGIEKLGQDDNFLVACLSVLFWQVLFSSSHHVFNSLSISYHQLTCFKQREWRIHAVSFVNAFILCTLAFPILFDKTLAADPIYGYSVYPAKVYAITVGYFFWDMIICLWRVQSNGMGFLVHAISCFTVFLFGFVCYFNNSNRSVNFTVGSFSCLSFLRPF